MKKLEFGLLILCVLVGSYFGSIFGIAIAFAVYMVITGVIEETSKQRRENNDKKGGKVNA